MIFCDQCFLDNELVSIIQSFNNLGNCELCGAKEAFIYDTEEQPDITYMFDEFIGIYTPANNLPAQFPKSQIKPLIDHLNEDWHVFNFGPDKIKLFLESLLYHRYITESDLFQGPVGILELADEDYLEEYSILKTSNWEDFAQSIKFEYRYHSNHMNTKNLSVFCDHVRKRYPKGHKFYRARISSKEGYPQDQMGAPPVEKSKDGRANVQGIPVLYLGSNQELCIAESRAAIHDYLAIATFTLRESLQVVDLTAVDRISPFARLSTVQHAINKEHLRKISLEIAKPIRWSDSRLDYVPTQYICDFIKGITERGQKVYGGIQYDSTRSEFGYNLAIFDSGVVACESVEVREITDVIYKHVG